MRDSMFFLLRRSLRVVAAGALALAVAMPAAAAEDDLAEMSLEDLMNLTVTSASKREESKVDAAAAITVLTQEDIRRSGATSIPEVLRMVPGLNVARIDASRWAISARGYNNQFANKLLVLMDGRVLYSQLFGGVYWDVQDTVMADIERIEVIRGPGGTLWGANAVNGVINITTKNAKDTKGIHAMGLAGNQEYLGEGRIGAGIGEKTSFRVFGRGFKRNDFELPPTAPSPANDEWHQGRVGARFDSQITDDDLVTVQGDFYDGQAAQVDINGLPTEDTKVRGGNIVSRWTHSFSETQSTQLQFFYDYTERFSGLDETRNTIDALFQHDFTLGQNDEWLFNWGAEYFWSQDDTEGGTFIAFTPESDTFQRFSGFVQVGWHLWDDRLQLTAGTKLEWNNYTDFEYQPSGRALFKLFEGNAIWGAASRAVRAPTRVDRDLDFAGPPVVVGGGDDIVSEDLFAGEFGYRNYMLENLTFDLAVFFNDYSNSTLLVPAAAPPGSFEFDNASSSDSKGVEAEVAWQVAQGLRFVTSYTWLQIEEQIPVGGFQPFGDSEGTSPQHTWMLRGLWNMPWVPVELDGTVWYVSQLDSITPPDSATPPVDEYWRLDLRAAWRATDWLTLEFVGQNLIEDLHAEWGTPPLPLFPGTLVPRSYYGKATLTF